jgi:hypothetical protein
VKQDGTEKNDCERNAVKRFITKLRQDHPHLKVIIAEDAQSSNAPHIETLHDYGCHYILSVKEGDHDYLFIIRKLPASYRESIVPSLPHAVQGKPAVLRTLDSGRLSTKGILSRPEECLVDYCSATIG